MSSNKEDEKHAPEGGEKKTITRREWLIDIGKAAAVAGIAGKSVVAEGTSAHPIPAPAGAPASNQALPPGLYAPSEDHLTHALTHDKRFRPIPAGCPVDYVRPQSGPYQPQFFSPDQYKVIHRLTALMLGETSAPSESGGQGAVVDEVAEWVDLWNFSFADARKAAEKLTPEQRAVAQAYDGAPMVHHLETIDPQTTYRKGLTWLDEESRRHHQKGFAELAENQQVSVLDEISDARADLKTENDGTRFFKQLKDDVVNGFYTSRTGLTELKYKGNAFYAESPGCGLPLGHHVKRVP